MTEQKETLLAELTTARNELWALLEPIDEATEIYPGWNKRDFFAHIAGWEALVYGAFRDRAAGVAGTGVYPFESLEAANAHFVGVRRSMTLFDAKTECEIYRDAIERMLEAIPAAQYAEMVQLPWGSEAITSFVRGAIQHEVDHAADIRQLRTA